MKIKALLLATLVTSGLSAEKAKKPYTAGMFFSDTCLILGGVCLLGLTAESTIRTYICTHQIKDVQQISNNVIGSIVRSAAEDRQLAERKHTLLGNMTHSTTMTFIMGAFGFGLVKRGIDNMFKHR
jgi:hypothetical protein